MSISAAQAGASEGRRHIESAVYDGADGAVALTKTKLGDKNRGTSEAVCKMKCTQAVWSLPM